MERADKSPFYTRLSPTLISMTLRYFPMAAALVALLATPLIAQAKLLNFNTALGKIVNQTEHDHLYSSWTKPECLNFDDDGEDSKFENITIHEVHDGKCPGDPNTAPVVDRFKVNRQTGQILWENLDGEDVPYAEVVKFRLKKQ
jgi:hypothetical protein